MDKLTKACGAIALGVTMALASCGGGEDKPPAAKPTTPRTEVEASFKGKTNPFKSADKAAIDAGKALFAANCVACHAESGEGQPSMKTLDVPPSNLRTKEIQDLPDDYIFFKVTKGGAIYKGGKGTSTMSPFAQLSEEERWKIIAYVRSMGVK